MTASRRPHNTTGNENSPQKNENACPVNRYTTRPVTDASYFVAARGGRGAQAHRLLRHLCRREPAPDSVSLVGDRRSGKTSLLGFLKKAAQKQPGLIPL